MDNVSTIYTPEAMAALQPALGKDEESPLTATIERSLAVIGDALDRGFRAWSDPELMPVHMPSQGQDASGPVWVQISQELYVRAYKIRILDPNTATEFVELEAIRTDDRVWKITQLRLRSKATPAHDDW